MNLRKFAIEKRTAQQQKKNFPSTLRYFFFANTGQVTQYKKNI